MEIAIRTISPVHILRRIAFERGLASGRKDAFTTLSVDERITSLLGEVSSSLAKAKEETFTSASASLALLAEQVRAMGHCGPLLLQGFETLRAIYNASLPAQKGSIPTYDYNPLDAFFVDAQKSDDQIREATATLYKKTKNVFVGVENEFVWTKVPLELKASFKYAISQFVFYAGRIEQAETLQKKVQEARQKVEIAMKVGKGFFTFLSRIARGISEEDRQELSTALENLAQARLKVKEKFPTADLNTDPTLAKASEFYRVAMAKSQEEWTQCYLRMNDYANLDDTARLRLLLNRWADIRLAENQEWNKYYVKVNVADLRPQIRALAPKEEVSVPPANPLVEKLKAFGGQIIGVVAVVAQAIKLWPPQESNAPVLPPPNHSKLVGHALAKHVELGVQVYEKDEAAKIAKEAQNKLESLEFKCDAMLEVGENAPLLIGKFYDSAKKGVQYAIPASSLLFGGITAYTSYATDIVEHMSKNGVIAGVVGFATVGLTAVGGSGAFVALAKQAYRAYYEGRREAVQNLKRHFGVDDWTHVRAKVENVIHLYDHSLRHPETDVGLLAKQLDAAQRELG